MGVAFLPPPQQPPPPEPPFGLDMADGSRTGLGGGGGGGPLNTCIPCG